MGWFSQQSIKCKECGKKVNTKGKIPQKGDTQLGIEKYGKMYPLSESYSCITSEGHLDLCARGPISKGDTVLCCGECTNKEDGPLIVSRWANKYGWG